MDERRTQDLISGGLGLLALALGVGAVLGVVRPPDGVVSSRPFVLGVVGLVAGFVGLYLSRTQGFGRQVAVAGSGVALLGLALYGGVRAIDALLDAAG